MIELFLTREAQERIPPLRWCSGQGLLLFPEPQLHTGHCSGHRAGGSGSSPAHQLELIPAHFPHLGVFLNTHTRVCLAPCAHGHHPSVFSPGLVAESEISCTHCWPLLFPALRFFVLLASLDHYLQWLSVLPLGAPSHARCLEPKGCEGVHPFARHPSTYLIPGFVSWPIITPSCWL